MKKKLLLLLCFAAPLLSYGQLQKGNWMATGAFGAGAGTTTFKGNVSGEFTNRIYLNASAGLLLTDRVALGISIDPTFYRTGQIGDNLAQPTGSRNTSLAVGPFLRTYHMLTEKAGIFTHTGVSYQRGITKSLTSNDVWEESSSHTTVLATAGLGFTYFFHPSFGAEIRLGTLEYGSNLSRNTDAGIERKSKNLSSSLVVNDPVVGFSYYF